MQLNCVWLQITPVPTPTSEVLSFNKLREFAKGGPSEAQGKLNFKYADLTFVISKRCTIDLWLKLQILENLKNIGDIITIIRQFIFTHSGYRLGSFKTKFIQAQASSSHNLSDRELYNFIGRANLIPNAIVLKPPGTEHRLLYNIKTDFGYLLLESGRLSLTTPNLSNLVELYNWVEKHL